MKTYLEERTTDLLTKISTLTKIPAEKLQEHGVKFTMDHPQAIGATKAQLSKLLLLKELINQYNEVSFIQEQPKLNSSALAGEYILTRLKGVLDREKFEITFLTAQNDVIATKTIFEGTINEAPIYPREIVRDVLAHDANSVVISHNHPGGSMKPSNADLDVTRKIAAALKAIGVKLLDHIIVAGDRYISLAEQGYIDFI